MFRGDWRKANVRSKTHRRDIDKLSDFVAALAAIALSAPCRSVSSARRFREIRLGEHPKNLANIE